jgi:hypothetical protein
MHEIEDLNFPSLYFYFYSKRWEVKGKRRRTIGTLLRIVG